MVNLNFGSAATMNGSFSAKRPNVYNNTVMHFAGPVGPLGNLSVFNNATADFSPASGGPATLNLSGLTLSSGGTLTGSDSFVDSGAFTWSGGTLSTPGLTVQGNATINDVNNTLDGTHLVTAGANNTWTSTVHAGDGAIWDVPLSATLTAVQGGRNATLANDVGNGVATLNNYGTITSQVGSGYGIIIVTAFQNYGAVTVASGDFALGGGGTLNGGSSITGANGSSFGFFGGSWTFAASSSIQGDLVNFNLGSAVTVNGTFQANQVNVYNNTTVTFTGTVIEQLGGLSQYGQIEVITGSLTLAGSLQIALVNGFVPRPGSQFTIIDDQTSQPINGAFTNLARGGAIWDTSHTERFPITYIGGEGNDAVLTATAPLTVKTNSSLMLVGNSPPPLTGTVNGTPFTGSITYTTAFGDQVTVTLGTAATAASAVGQYAITATLSGANASNYFIDPTTSQTGTTYVVSLGVDPSGTGGLSVVFWDNKGTPS